VIAGTFANQFACDATISDKRDIDLLCPAGFKYRDAHRIHLESKSNTITIEVAEYCIAHPPFMHYYREIVEVSKYHPIRFSVQLNLACIDSFRTCNSLLESPDVREEASACTPV